jgi:hypothetical protein
MRHASRALLAGGLGLAVSFLVACGGGSGLLSSDQASTLNSQLDQVSSAVGSGNCAAASSAVSDFSNMVSNLPTGVNQTLRDNLSQDASRLGQLAAADCQNATTTTSTTTTSTSSTPTSTTSSSTTTPATITSASATSTATSTATTSADTGTSTTGTSGGAGLGGNGGGSGGRGTGGAGAGGNGQ